jgi:hypothetical protein
MKNKLLYLLPAIILIIAGCNKSDENAITRVGFYCQSQSTPDHTEIYRLFIDDKYICDLRVDDKELSCGAEQMKYVELNGKEHQVDLKDENDRYLSANYLKVQKNKMETGSSHNPEKQVEGTNGCSFRSADDCSVFAFFVD